MNPFHRRRRAPSGPAWADTQPSQPPLPGGPGRGAGAVLTGHAPLDGVEVDELSSQTVFDQFFGGPESPPR